MKKKLLISTLFLLFGTIVFSQTIPTDSLYLAIPTDSLYLGQTPPGSTPVVFAPGIVSLEGRTDRTITFSLSGQEVFFAIGNWPTRITLHSEYKNNAWTSIDTASFSTNNSAEEPIFSPDGNRVYYYAYLPGSSTNSEINYSEKSGEVWGESVNIGNPPNSSADEYHPCVVNDTSIYFINASGKIYRSQFLNGAYQTSVILPTIINEGYSWRDPYIAPDESYIVFGSNKSGGYGSYDLYISYKKDDESWTNPKNLGNKINTSAFENSPDITPDGKYMTFDYNDDIYWVSSSFIDSLKHTNSIPYFNNYIPNQTDTVGKSISFTISDSTFIDDDGNNTLTWSTTLSDESALPSWLTFTPATRVFEGTPTESGTISIKVTVTDTANATASTTFDLEVKSTPTSIEETSIQNFQIYPNPSNGLIYLSSGSFSEELIKLEIYNLLGEVVHKNTFKNEAIIDLTGKQNGLYLIRLYIDNKVIVKKLYIE